MNLKILIIFLLSVLVIVSFVQSIQISNIKQSFIESPTGAAVQSATNTNSYSNPAANAPAMVGGY